MKPIMKCNICFQKGDGFWAGKHTNDTGHEWYAMEGEDEPPSSLDIASRCISPISILFREIQRYTSRVDAVCLISGAGLRRRSFNL